MSFDLLLEQFDKSVRTPTDLEKLRAAILDWAIRGLLNTQNPNDDPVDALIERIMSQRQAMIVVNGNVKPKNISPIKPSEIPYKLPENWRWVRLPAVYYTHGQKKPDRTFTYIDVSSIDNERGVIGPDLQVIEAKNAPSRARKQVAPGTVIYSTVRPYLLNIAIVEQEYDPKPIISTAFAVMHPFQGVLNKYLFYYLRSPSFTTFVEGQMTGMAYPAISDSKLNKGLFPLPPFEEQKRIVARVKQLRAHAYELASRLDTADSQRKKFHTSAIHRLTEAKTPQETGVAWHLIRNNFDRLYTEPQTIDELKQAILQLAVMGRLVPQDPSDETAEVLLERITAEREMLAKLGKLKKRKKSVQLASSDLPYSVPDSWTWCKFDEIAANKPSALKAGPFGSSLKKQFYVPAGYKIYGQEQVINDDPYYGDYYIDKDRFDSLKSNEVSAGDILISLVGTIGKVLILPDDHEPGIINPRLVKLSLFQNINREFIKYYLYSPVAKGILSDRSHGGTMSILNLGILRRLPIPLPPISEQTRIVEKVDALLELTRNLGDRIETADSQRTRLLDAILSKNSVR